jgi:hypothetical protein
MSEPAKVIPIASVELSDDQREAIEEAGNWSAAAMAALGASYLEYSDAEVRYTTAKARLSKHRSAAIEAEMSRGNVIAAIGHALQLPPGEWTFDPKQGKLVKKDT